MSQFSRSKKCLNHERRDSNDETVVLFRAKDGRVLSSSTTVLTPLSGRCSPKQQIRHHRRHHHRESINFSSVSEETSSSASNSSGASASDDTNSIFISSSFSPSKLSSNNSKETDLQTNLHPLSGSEHGKHDSNVHPSSHTIPDIFGKYSAVFTPEMKETDSDGVSTISSQDPCVRHPRNSKTSFFCDTKHNQKVNPIAKGRCYMKRILHEMERKRSLRVGINLFNLEMKVGIGYLIRHDFVKSYSAHVFAKFLITYQFELSRQSVGSLLTQHVVDCIHPDQLLTSYLSYLQFRNRKFDKCLRDVLRLIIIPSSKECMQRFAKLFTDHYLCINPPSSSTQHKCQSAFMAAIVYTVMLYFNHNETNYEYGHEKKDPHTLSKSQFIQAVKNSIKHFHPGSSTTTPPEIKTKLVKHVYSKFRNQPIKTSPNFFNLTNSIFSDLRASACNSSSGSKCKVVSDHIYRHLSPSRRLICSCKLSFQVQYHHHSPRTLSPLKGADVVHLFNDCVLVKPHELTAVGKTFFFIQLKSVVEMNTDEQRWSRPNNEGSLVATQNATGVNMLVKPDGFLTPSHDFNGEEVDPLFDISFESSDSKTMSQFILDLNETLIEVQDLLDTTSSSPLL